MQLIYSDKKTDQQFPEDETEKLQRDTRKLLQVIDIVRYFDCGDSFINENISSIKLHALSMCSLLHTNYNKAVEINTNAWVTLQPQIRMSFPLEINILKSSLDDCKCAAKNENHCSIAIILSLLQFPWNASLKQVYFITTHSFSIFQRLASEPLNYCELLS